MYAIAIIPARGGSERLPRKNIKLLDGKPLVCYTIEAALAAKHILSVFVSTEDAVIAEISRRAGATVPYMRPAELATSHSNMFDVLENMYISLKLRPFNIACLFPTSPLRSSKDIDGAIELFSDKKADNVISYTKAAHPFSYLSELDINGQHLWNPYLEQGVKWQSTQESKPVYIRNGAIYILNYDKNIAPRLLFTKRTFGYIMPPERSVDIDTQNDFDYAEYLMKKKREVKCQKKLKSVQLQ